MIGRMRHELSCGFLIFQNRPRRSVLLLVDGERLDLPKGRAKRGESKLECALRELEEETGLRKSDISIVDGFRVETSYHPKRDTEKTVVLFAAELEGPCGVVTPDHDDYVWLPWRPPHDLHMFPTIHNGLAAWEHFSSERLSERASPRRRRAS